MTENKPIMIDVVDVSGCELYRNDNGVFAPDGTAERTELCYLTNDYCGNNTNCYYKQLARKTQECKELRTDIKDIANLLDLDTGEEYNFGNIEMAIKGLKQECEELKNKLIQKDEINTFFNTPIEGWDNDPCKICESKQNYEQLKTENEECKKLNDTSILHRICLDDDLQQAEQKINKIKDKCNETLELMDKDSGTNAYAGGRCTEAVQILQIIGEVE